METFEWSYFREKIGTDGNVPYYVSYKEWGGSEIYYTNPYFTKFWIKQRTKIYLFLHCCEFGTFWSEPDPEERSGASPILYLQNKIGRKKIKKIHISHRCLWKVRSGPVKKIQHHYSYDLDPESAILRQIIK